MLMRLIFCLALVACGNEFSPPPKVVEAEVIKKDRFLLTTRLIGSIKAKNETILTAKTDGAVDFFVHPGDSVKKGTVIAEIEAADLKKSFDLSTQAYEIAQKKYERAVALSKSKTVSTQELEEREKEMINAEKDYRASKRQLEQSQFIAPFDGIVGVFKIREGSHMNAGNVLVAFFQPDKLIVTFDIPEDLVPRVKKGQKVFAGGKEFTLTGYQPVIDPETHMALASFDYSCDNCVIGSNVDVELALIDKEQAMSVPLEAIYYKDNQAFVFVIKEGKAMPQKITLGERAENRFEVLDGLSEGDQVVSKNISRLWPTVDVVVEGQGKQEGDKAAKSADKEKPEPSPQKEKSEQ